MQAANAQQVMDYTTVPVGLRIEGRLWTGQSTAFTGGCPKCGRIGVVSAIQNGVRVIVHTGHVNGKSLKGLDFCTLGSHGALGSKNRLPDTPAGLHTTLSQTVGAEG